VRVIGPQTLMPAGVESLRRARVPRHARGLKGCDVVMMLRLQNERMNGPLLPSAAEFFRNYGLTAEKLALAKSGCHRDAPGPMNRGVEIDSPVADGPRSVILPQVTFGIAVRMAVMSIVAGTDEAALSRAGAWSTRRAGGTRSRGRFHLPMERSSGQKEKADRTIDAKGLVVAPA
jgi:aspartate carbamoyltransferase catalytic subunit